MNHADIFFVIEFYRKCSFKVLFFNIDKYCVMQIGLYSLLKFFKLFII